MRNSRTVRMKRWAHPVVPMELEAGDVVQLPAYLADQFIANDMAELITEAEEYEAAALRPARRRG